MYDKYLIKHGEDLKTIAKKFNTEESVILELNNIPFSDNSDILEYDVNKSYNWFM